MLYSQLPTVDEYTSYRARRAAHQKALFGHTLAELQAEAKVWDIPRHSRKTKEQLVYALATAYSDYETCEDVNDI